MNIKEAAKELSRRTQQTIGYKGVVTLMSRGVLGYIDAGGDDSKRRNVIITPEHIEQFLGRRAIRDSDKLKKSEIKKFASHPRVHC